MIWTECPHCGAGMERVKEPGLRIPGNGRLYFNPMPLVYWRCWICGERVYWRWQATRRASLVAYQRLAQVLCVRCGQPMAPKEDGRGECPACIARRDYGRAVCPVCGETFTKRTPPQVTCGKPECRRRRNCQSSAEADKRRRRGRWVRLMESINQNGALNAPLGEKQ